MHKTWGWNINWQTGRAPTEPGVYLFTIGEDVVYVGSTKNLHSRIFHHLTSPWYRAIPMYGRIEPEVQWAVITGHRALEIDLIAAYEPVLNIRSIPVL